MIPTFLASVVVLSLTVADQSTGELLFEQEIIPSEMSFFPMVYGDPMENCRKLGIEMAYDLTVLWRFWNTEASTNVSCHWELRPAGRPGGKTIVPF